MRRMRTRLLLGAIACLVLAAPLAAQVAPTVTGETGLFQIITADMLPQGRFSLGLSWGLWNRTAAPVPHTAPLPDDPLRYDLQRFGGSVAYGLMSNWEVDREHGRQPLQRVRLQLAGSHQRALSFRRIHAHARRTRSASERRSASTRGIRSSSRSSAASGFRPSPATTRTRSARSRADYDFGLSFTFGWVTFQTAYQLNGDVGTPTPSQNAGPVGYDLSNTWTNAVGVAVPLIPGFFKLIGEINRVHYDGGDTQPPDFSEATRRRSNRIRSLHGVRRRAREHRPLGEIRKHALEHRRPRSGRLPSVRSGRRAAARRPAPRSRARSARHRTRAAAAAPSRAGRGPPGRACRSPRPRPGLPPRRPTRSSSTPPRAASRTSRRPSWTASPSA